MKLLQIQAEGMELFPRTLNLSFYATQRVRTTDQVNLQHICSNLYYNRSNAFIGINASGKTTVLRLLVMILTMLDGTPINRNQTEGVLGNSSHVVLTTYFMYDNSNLYKLRTVVTSKKGVPVGEKKYTITAETLWKKTIGEKAVSAKKTAFEPSGFKLIQERTGEEDYLADDISIAISVKKLYQEETYIANLVSLANHNYPLIGSTEEVFIEALRFLDPSIEYLLVNSDDETIWGYQLKFYGKDEIEVRNYLELERYLSSGTIRGLGVFGIAKQALKSGGYMVLDEIEDHFNREIVATLLRFFQNEETNPNGAVLLFSTHYPNLLDEFDRNDAITVLWNNSGIEAHTLANLLKRNDVKKSDSYESSFLGETAPTYETYIAMKRALLKELREG